MIVQGPRCQLIVQDLKCRLVVQSVQITVLIHYTPLCYEEGSLGINDYLYHVGMTIICSLPLFLINAVTPKRWYYPN